MLENELLALTLQEWRVLLSLASMMVILSQSVGSWVILLMSSMLAYLLALLKLVSMLENKSAWASSLVFLLMASSLVFLLMASSWGLWSSASA